MDNLITTENESYDGSKYKELNQDSFLNYCINKYSIESFGTFNSFVYYDIDKFFMSEECNMTLETALKWAKAKRYKPVSQYQLAVNSSSGENYNKLGYELLSNETAFAYKKEGSKTRIEILFKEKDNPDGSIKCRGKHFATIRLVNDASPTTISSLESFVSAIHMPANVRFDKYCDYLTKMGDEWKELSIETLIFEEIYYEKSSEGFADTAKKVGKKILDGIIFAIKTIINWLIKFVSIIGNFIKSNVLEKLFPKKDPKEIERLYSVYGKMPLSSSDNVDDNGRQLLPEHLWNELYYTKFDLDSYSRIERVTAATKVAVDTIYQSMKSAYKKKTFLRTYNVKYNKKFEEDYVQRVRPTSSSRELFPLEFYHERNFMHFIYTIDKLTNGSIKDLIVDDPLNDMRLERKIKLGNDKYKGSIVAKAVICGKTIDQMAMNINNANNSQKQIAIKDVVSGDLLKALYSQNDSYFKQINKEAQKTIEISKKLQEASKDFYAEIEDIKNTATEFVAESNYVGIREFSEWINFLVDFSQTFFNYRINMIKAVRLVMRKLEHKQVEESAIRPGEYNSRIGRIRVYSEEEFNKLTGKDIQKISKDIVDKTLKGTSGNSTQKYKSMIKYFS
jgi:hypothetical protein